MPDPLKFADHAANQNDRWLLIFVLFVSFIGVIWLVKWLVRRLEKQAEALTVFGNRVTEVVASNTVHVQSCAERIRESTEHIRSSTELMRRLNEHFARNDIRGD